MILIEAAAVFSIVLCSEAMVYLLPFQLKLDKGLYGSASVVVNFSIKGIPALGENMDFRFNFWSEKELLFQFNPRVITGTGNTRYEIVSNSEFLEGGTLKWAQEDIRVFTYPMWPYITASTTKIVFGGLNHTHVQIVSFTQPVANWVFYYDIAKAHSKMESTLKHGGPEDMRKVEIQGDLVLNSIEYVT